MSAADRRFLIIAGVLGGVLVVGLCWRAALTTRVERRPSVVEMQRTPSLPAGDRKTASHGTVTLQNFNLLKRGMSRTAAEQLLGKGEVLSSFDVPTVGRHVSLTWRESPRAIVCEFVNDQLESKQKYNFD